MIRTYCSTLSKYFPRTYTDQIASLLTSVLIPTYYIFETFYIMPQVLFTSASVTGDVPLSGTGDVHNKVELSANMNYIKQTFHTIAATILFINASTSFIKIIVTENTSGSTILPSILGENWRFCVVCESTAPPRSYHCRTCNKCILKRDHHCTFTGNCIGYYNHRYFMSFLLYMVTAGVYSCYMNAMFLSVNMHNWSVLSIFSFLFPFIAVIFRLPREFSIITSFLMSFALFGTLLLIALFGYHIRNVLAGQLGHERAHRITRYSRTTAENLAVVMGGNWKYAWLSPFIDSPMTGDGITFNEQDAYKTKRT